MKCIQVHPAVTAATLLRLAFAGVLSSAGVLP
jgi:hypothetical protein